MAITFGQTTVSPRNLILSNITGGVNYLQNKSDILNLALWQKFSLRFASVCVC